MLTYFSRKLSYSPNNSFYNSILKNISISTDELKKNIISPIFSAKGSLLLIASSNGDYEELYGVNQYNQEQLIFYQNLPNDLIARLCMIDVNYILPCVAIKSKEQVSLKRKN